ncbi:MAG TPA: threonine aldolase [Spirochaetes bacterium]|nr:threonine aldolase [Spirochaetota bacterium]
MKIIDLRRDTITLPSIKMCEDAFKAVLGDSVYDEDPRQCELEKRAATITAKEKGIFVPSGTMGNLIALLTHTQKGEEIIVEENAHIRTSETGGAACVGGLMIKTVAGKDGAPDPAGVERAIRDDNIHYPGTSLICLETTHYRYGGIVPPLSKFGDISRISKRRGVPVHLDGARLFNASVYLGVQPGEIAGFADSVMISLSKGLGAPVGSVLCGSGEFIEKAKRYRKMLGGGMRQTGWLCAAGLEALSDDNISRLKEDHQNARLLAEGLASLPGIEIDLNMVHTNFVKTFFEDPGRDAQAFAGLLSSKGIRATAAGRNELRFVTSKEVSRDDILSTIEVIKGIYP